MDSEKNIREGILRELVDSLAVSGVVIRGERQGFSLSARVGGKDRVLETARGQARLFASLDTAASFAKGIGIPLFEVDMSSYQPGRLRSARPDRSAALKKTRTQLKQQPLGI